MKADFEKGIKICSKCKKELPIEMFRKNRVSIDGLHNQCRECEKEYNDKMKNVFSGNLKVKRGSSNIVKRDYELTEEQLKKRDNNRWYKNRTKSKKINPHGILIWYSGKLNKLDCESYRKILIREYNRQSRCAICGHVGRVKPSEHFLFDFDLEQMLKDNVYCSDGKYKKHITKWWNGEIKHWTVNDGIWRN